jgi:hypothetical protein
MVFQTTTKNMTTTMTRPVQVTGVYCPEGRPLGAFGEKSPVRMRHTTVAELLGEALSDEPEQSFGTQGPFVPHRHSQPARLVGVSGNPLFGTGPDEEEK